MIAKFRKLTYADYEKIPDDGRRHEIIEGEELMTPVPNLDHQDVVLNLASLLRAHVRRKKLGRVFVAPADVVLSKHDIVQPDALFVRAERLSICTEKNVQGAPDLVIEVVLPTTAAVDRGRKLALYERAGVGEYWIVDPGAKTVEVHEFGDPRRTRVYRDGDSFESALLPGLTVRTAEVF